MKKAAWLCIILATSLKADIVFNGIGEFPHFADGGGWKSVITLINLDETSASFTIRFYADDGTLQSLPLVDGSTASSVSGTIAPRGTRTIETTGTAPGLTWGWAFVSTSATIGGVLTMRYSLPGQVPIQAQFPIDTTVFSKFALPVDQADGAGVGLAISNPVPFASEPVFLVFRDENGAPYKLDTFTLGPLNHTAFTLTVRYPETIGKRGTVEVSTSGLWLGVLAINSAKGSFSTVTPLISEFWLQ